MVCAGRQVGECRVNAAAKGTAGIVAGSGHVAGAPRDMVQSCMCGVCVAGCLQYATQIAAFGKAILK